MPISSGNLKLYLSGGIGNDDPDLSLGGDRSETVMASGLNNLFDDVRGDESLAGAVEYRCLYFRNEDADPTGLLDPVVWIVAQTSSPDTTLAIGIDPAGKNAEAASIADPTEAPAGVVFFEPASKVTGLALPSGPYQADDEVPIWIRRSVEAGAASSPSAIATLRIEGDTV